MIRERDGICDQMIEFAGIKDYGFEVLNYLFLYWMGIHQHVVWDRAVHL